MFSIINYLRQRWASISQASGQQGTFIDELVTKPTGVVLREFYNSLVSARRVNNIDMWREMSDEELDAFGNKFFAPRANGERASGNVTIYFDTAVDFELTKDTVVLSESKSQFEPVQLMRVSKSLLSRSSAPYAMYEFSFPVTAKKAGSGGNIEPGGIKEITGIGVPYKFITNKSAISGGVYREDNEAYAKRLRYAVNDRSMSNVRAIISTLPDFFSSIKSIYVAGAGNRYMTRDIIQGFQPGNGDITFLGKTPGNNTVNHVAIPDLFPPRPESATYAEYDPFTLSSSHTKPLSIAPIVEGGDDQAQSSDPALDGINLSIEATHEQYAGLFFNDFVSSMDVETSSLFDMARDGADQFVIGSNGKQEGVFESFLGGVPQDANPIQMSNDTIIMSPHLKNRDTIVAMRNIGKRGGVKLVGTVKIPNSQDVFGSTLQIGVAGDNSKNPIHAFTGIGFGIHPYEPESGNNAAVFIYCGTNYDEGQVYSTNEFFNNGSSVSDLNALIEAHTNIALGEEYEFELVFHDETSRGRNSDREFSVTLTLSPVDSDVGDEIRIAAPPNVFRPFKNFILNRTSPYFGEHIKFSLTAETPHQLDWVISSIVARDLSRSRAQVFVAMDVESLDGGANISLSAFGSGHSGSSEIEGVEAFIWNPKAPLLFTPSSQLNTGAWEKIFSLPEGAATLSNLSSHHIRDVQKYKLGGALNGKIALLVQSAGESVTFSRHNNETMEDVDSILRVGYIGVSGDMSKFYHSNTDVDIYLSTFHNTERLPEQTASLTKPANVGYFEISERTGFVTPLASIVNIATADLDGATSMVPSESYRLVYDDDKYRGSTKESIKLVLDDGSINSISITYSHYPKIAEVQKHFSSSQYRQVFGDFLVRHNFPCFINVSLSYIGRKDPEIINEVITRYVDDHVTSVFSRDHLIQYLHENGHITRVADNGLTITYEALNDDFESVSGEITAENGYKLEIRPIDFFYLSSVQSVRVN